MAGDVPHGPFRVDFAVRYIREARLAAWESASSQGGMWARSSGTLPSATRQAGHCITTNPEAGRGHVVVPGGHESCALAIMRSARHDVVLPRRSPRLRFLLRCRWR